MIFFKFKIKEYFSLFDNYIGMIGDMMPPDFPIVTQKYFLKLVINNKTVHIFKSFGEEIPARIDPNIRIRAFRTSDDIKELLQSGLKEGVYIVGSLDKKVLEEDFKIT